MIVGKDNFKDNFKDRFAMFACIALGDEGIYSSPKVLKSEQDGKDEGNTWTKRIFTSNTSLIL